MANPLRKTMVYLGLADEDLDYEDATAHTPAAQAPAAQPTHQSAVSVPNRAPVTPLRRSSMPRTAPPAEMNEILTVHPRQYRDAQVIAESFRDVINLTQMSESDARRLIDFASGLSQGLYGKIERVTSKVFLLSPANVAVSGEGADPSVDVDASFFVHS